MSKKIVSFSAFLAPILCFSFGMLLLIFVVGPGDGTWQLYAQQMLRGNRIYSDLGLNQQPLFPLISLVGEEIFPGDILLGKLVFVPVLVIYIGMMFYICRMSNQGVFFRSLLLLSAFFVSIHFEAFRFDDYHGLGGLLALASLCISTRFLRGDLALINFGIAQALVTMAAALTRPNDGIALALAAAVVLFLHRPLNREMAKMAAASIVVAGVVFFATLACINETPASWLDHSVLEASAAKGGSGLLHYPGMLLKGSFEYVLSELVERKWPYFLLFFVALAAGVRMERGNWRFRRLGSVMASAGLLPLLSALWEPSLIENLAAPFALFVTAGLVWTVAAALKHRVLRGVGEDCRPDWSLLAYPVFLFLFGSLSSGGTVYGLYQPVALTLLVIAIVGGRGTGILRKNAAIQVVFLTLCAVTAWQGASARWRNPYSWQTYHVPPFFEDNLFRNDKRGPHFISSELDDLIVPVCDVISPGKTLLSLPYSFANYYCEIDPWRGYVQTYFDTSTSSRIYQLMESLKKDPPDYIFYQRQMGILGEHEVLFHHGAPLPHRALDTLIMGRIESGQWKVASESWAYSPSDWMLIETRPE